MKRNNLKLVLALAAFSVLPAFSARAVNSDLWTNGGAAGSWTDVNNWSVRLSTTHALPTTAAATTGSGDTVLFEDWGLSSTSSINTGANQAFGKINLGDGYGGSTTIPSLTQDLTINNNTITLYGPTSGGVPQAINRPAGVSGTQTINSNLTIANTNTTSQTTTYAFNILGSSGSVVINGVLSSTTTTTAQPSIDKLGIGTLVLAGANTFAGAYLAYGGTTILANAAAIPASAGTISLGTSSSPINASILTNSVNLVRPVNARNTGSDTYLLTVGGSPDNTASTWSGGVLLNQSILVTGGVAGTVTFTGAIVKNTGTVLSSNLTKIDNGTVVLQGANTYTGLTTVNAGLLVADSTSQATVLASATGLVLGGGTFQYKGAVSQARSQTVSGLTLNAGGSVVDVSNVGTSTTLDLRGAGASAITRVAGGTVDFRADTGGPLNATTATIKTAQTNDPGGILGGWATVNSGSDLASNDGSGNIVACNGYTNIADGSSTIADGSTTNVRLNSAGAPGAIALGAATTNVDTLTQNSTVNASTVATAGSVLRLGLAGGVLVTPGAQSLTIGANANDGTLTAGGNTNGVAGELILANYSANPLTVNAAIADNQGGQVAVTKSGSGLVVLAGGNTYSGATNLNGGVTQIGGAAVLPHGAGAGNVAINLGATLDLNGHNITVNGLLGAGTVDNTAVGAVTLTAGDNNTAATFSGAINNTAGAIALTKTGTGTLILTGTSGYSGATTVNPGGTLQVGNGGTTGSISSTSGVIDNGTLTFNRIDTITFAPPISGAGAVTQSGAAGVLVLTGNNSYTGVTTISAGALEIGNGGTTGSINSTSGVVDNGSLVFNRADNAVFPAPISGTGSIFKSGPGTVALTGALSYTGTTSAVYAGTLQFGNGGTTGGLSGNIVDYATVAFDLSGTYTYAGVISGNGGLTQAGSGTLILTGATTYAGTTTINAGSTLQMGNAGATGLITYGNSASIIDNGTFIISRSNSINFNVPISGSGSLTINGTGTGSITTTNNHSYTGATVINSGAILVLGNGSVDGSINNTSSFSGSGTLAFYPAYSVAPAPVIGGNLSLLVEGPSSHSGLLTLVNANPYTGTTTVADTNLNINNLHALGSGKLTISSSVYSAKVQILKGLSDATTTPTALNLASLTLSSSGGYTSSLDITNNDVVINAASNPSISTVDQWIHTNQIITSATSGSYTAAIATLTGSQYQALHGGASALFDGQTLNAGDVLLVYTYAGDANVDGIVTADDYLAIDLGFIFGLTGWIHGDFNHDGVVDASDFALIDANFAASHQNGPLAAQEESLHSQWFGSAYTSALSGLTSVPEPASLGWLAAGAVGLLARRRR